MKNALAAFGVMMAIIFIVLAGFGMTWLVQGNEFFLYKVFAPQQEAVRREVFEKSKAFNQGMIQELENMRFEYVKAVPEHKDALASIILHRVSDYDTNQLPPDLRGFIDGLRRERTMAR